MIVNTAYPYMKSAVPVNPVVFDGNTVNYPYTIEGNVSLDGNGFRFGGGSASVQFKNMDLTKYTKLNLTARNTYVLRENIQIQIISSDGSASGNLVYPIPDGSTANYDREIPAAFRTKKCTLKLYMVSSSSPGITAMNLTCK
nr:MAG TPA: hypothetical protein [Caudoviricetes sp.]